MIESPHWQFDIEVKPPNWHFPAGKTWLAGWIRPKTGQVITDIRAQLHHRIILGLAGLPHPAFRKNSAGQTGLSHPGFSFLFTPHPGATRLQLEVRDQSGRWTEFFRTEITMAPDLPPPEPARALTPSLRGLITTLLRNRMRSRDRTWTDLAEELMAGFVAEPLNTHPNAPFIGALEEPDDIGRLRYGLISVTGWLAHAQTRITQLTAVIEPEPAVMLPHSLVRQDIATVFPALDGQTKSAFAGVIALPPDIATPVLLKLFAELEPGEPHLVFARRFFPHHHGATGEMPPLVTRLIFISAVWALYRAAGRHALPRQGLIRTAITIWADYQARPAYHPDKKYSRPGRSPFQASISPPPRQPAASMPAPSPVQPSCTIIAAADDMYLNNTSQYFQIGRGALTLIQHAGRMAGCKRIESILDLPCGHGRVARWLHTAYPTARLSVSDTQGPGVAFCIEQLGATGVQAAVDGRHWQRLPGPYDIIWCGSLLTHFDREQWVTHLRRFAERLTANGVLVFTTHGLAALDKLQCGEKDYGLLPAGIKDLDARTVVDGFGYVAYPDTPEYGISIAQPAWILELIARETDLRVLDIIEAAWDQHQDVVICTRRGK